MAEIEATKEELSIMLMRLYGAAATYETAHSRYFRGALKACLEEARHFFRAHPGTDDYEIVEASKVEPKST